MNTDTQNLATLRRLIGIELERCTHNHWPHVCRMQSTPEGRRRLEEAVIKMALEEGIPAGAAIAQIELDLNHPSDE